MFGSALVFAQTNTISIPEIQSLIRSRHYDQALQATRSGLKATPGDFRLWALEGITLSLMGQTKESLSAFDHSLRLSPDYPVALKGEVQLLYATRDEHAIPLLERILKQDAKDRTAREMLAMLEARQGNCEAAKANFLTIAQAIDSHPESLEAYGKCLVEAKDPQDAIPVFERLAALLPKQTYPQYDLAVVLVESKQNETALKILDPLLAANPSDPEIMSLASEAYESSGDTPKAVALLRQAIVLSPGTSSYYASFAAICLTHESYQVGIDMIDAGLHWIPNDPSLFLSRGLLYAQLAQYDKAEADFEKAEQIDSKQSISSYAIDLAELQKNNPTKAMDQIRAQLKEHPESALLHYLLAKLLSDQGSETDSKVNEEAIREAAKAVSLKPDLIEARDLLGGMYARSSRYDLAIEQCRQALQINPSDQSAIYHLIVALRHSAKPEDRSEIPSLVKRLSELQTTSRQAETDRKRFKLVEPESGAQH
jgi:tetratricopeptide (TPR) repeat protein